MASGVGHHEHITWLSVLSAKEIYASGPAPLVCSEFLYFIKRGPRLTPGAAGRSDHPGMRPGGRSGAAGRPGLRD